MPLNINATFLARTAHLIFNVFPDIKGIQVCDFKDPILKTFALRSPELLSVNQIILFIFLHILNGGSFQY